MGQNAGLNLVLVRITRQTASARPAVPSRKARSYSSSPDRSSCRKIERTKVLKDTMCQLVIRNEHAQRQSQRAAEELALRLSKDRTIRVSTPGWSPIPVYARAHRRAGWSLTRGPRAVQISTASMSLPCHKSESAKVVDVASVCRGGQVRGRAASSPA